MYNPVYEYRNRHKKCKYSHFIFLRQLFQTWYLWKRDKQNIMLFLNHYKYISHHFSANFHLISWALNIENFILVLSVWCVIVKKLSKSFIYHLKSNVSDKSWILNRVFCVLGRTSNEFWYLSGIKASWEKARMYKTMSKFQFHWHLLLC